MAICWFIKFNIEKSSHHHHHFCLISWFDGGQLEKKIEFRSVYLICNSPNCPLCLARQLGIGFGPLWTNSTVHSFEIFLLQTYHLVMKSWQFLQRSSQKVRRMKNQNEAGEKATGRTTYKENMGVSTLWTAISNLRTSIII